MSASRVHAGGGEGRSCSRAGATTWAPLVLLTCMIWAVMALALASTASAQVIDAGGDGVSPPAAGGDAPPPPPVDADADGVSPPADCDDGNPARNPGARDVPGDGIDQDCSGSDAQTDADSDGFGPPQDCNDANPAINPGARDIPRDGIDQDCSGADARMDADADGYGPPQDCNDTNASINPGAREIVGNGVDEDCSGTDAAQQQAASGAVGQSATPAAVLARRLFAVVRVRGITTRRGVRLRSITVDAPTGSAVRLLCGRRSCRVHRAARSRTIVTFTRFPRAFRAGEIVKVSITKPGMIGRYVQLKIRSGRPPLRQDLCLAPGSRRPSRCV